MPSPLLFATEDSAQGQLAANINNSTLSIPLGTGEGASFPQPLTGSASSTGSGTTLNDTGDLGSVAVGDVIYNITDGSWAIVTDISGAPNSVTTTSLRGGSDNTWQSGDEWRIRQFVVVIDDGDAAGDSATTREKILIKARSSDTLTVASGGRGYDGSSASSWTSGQYVRLQVLSVMPEGVEDAIAEITQIIDTNQTTMDDFIAQIGSTANGDGASVVGVEDSGGNFSGTDVEAVLAELQANIDALPVGQWYNKVVFASATTSGTLANPTSETNYDTYTYQIPANDLVAGVMYRFFLVGQCSWGAGTFTFAVRLGASGSDVFTFQVTPTATGAFTAEGQIAGTAAAGASVAVKGGGLFTQQAGATHQKLTQGLNLSPNSYATNGALDIYFSAVYGTSNGTNSTFIDHGWIEKIAPTLFS